MAEINGYLLTKEEEKACEDLIKKMRKKDAFEIEFTGCITVEAKNRDKAQEIFWNWIENIQRHYRTH